jgi:uncharacterized protein (TIGR00269 family)
MATCDKCRAESIIHQRYSGMHLCKAHFKDDVHRKIRENIRETGIFAHKARVAVALSGGKDSSVLLYALKDLFSKRKDIELIAIMIDEGIDGYRSRRLDSAKSLAKRLDIPYVIRSVGDVFGMTTDDVALLKHQEHGPAPCSYCKSVKDGLLNRAALELNADALATGHNLDDEAVSVLLGYLRGDIEGLFLLSQRISLPGIVRRIKPLRRVPEDEIALYASVQGLGHFEEACPHAGDAMRMEVRSALNDFEAGHPGTKYSMLRSLDRILDLKPESISQQAPCQMCGDAGQVVLRKALSADRQTGKN